MKGNQVVNKEKIRILIIALPGIGDALLSTPAIHLLREHYPNAQIDLLCMFQGAKDIFINNPDINNVVFWDFLKSPRIASFRFIFSLRGKYDASVNIYPQNRREYNLISFLIGAPKRIGVRYNHRDTQNFSWLLTHKIKENDTLHCVEENIALLRFFNISNADAPPLQLTLPPELMTWSEEWYKSQNINKGALVIGFHPGTAVFKNHVKRRWEPDKFSLLAKALIEKHNATIMLFGGKEESELRDQINKGADNRAIVVNTSSLMQTIALMKRCNLFVSNDSALMHVAGALQLPTVGIF
ncbi:MAG TPA: glycosyltransferase family 9 protein, partial [Candidatus Kapabacteria bacterium]|nr:glycosyltransferase family 9 protein [Candidatus Kapabacteria bacterium]